MFRVILIKPFRLSVLITSLSLLVALSGTNSALAYDSLPPKVGPTDNAPTYVTENSPLQLATLDPGKIVFREIIGGLTNPVFVTNAGDGSGRIFIVEQAGYIRILKNGSLLATPFLDIHTLVKSGGEQGLLALAFHPSYSTNGTFFVAYTAPRSGDSVGSNLVLEKFSVSTGNPDVADSASGVILLTISHPTYSNHNGGTLAFGGDGYLYWSTGDGGSGGDPANNAQQLNNLLGKILRIDVNSSSPYAIPANNPFYSSGDPNIKKEIWAYGLRNPWRMSFDRSTNDLYIGDVGQASREEVNFQSASSAGGENYGWRVMEGSICYNPSSGCNQSGKVLPVSEYDHTLGCSITGGYVYRGSDFPSLTGYYFYGDFCSGRLFALYNDPTLGWVSSQLVDTSFLITTFGEDEQGELYLIDRGTGKLYNIQYQDAPLVTSIVPANITPTNAASVDFTVTFSEPVTGVDTVGPIFDDFVLTTGPGISGAFVSNVSGSGTTYAITVTTGTGDGTIRLDVIDNDTILDETGLKLGGTGIGNGNFTGGTTYTIDRTAPNVSSISRTGSNPNTSPTVNFTVVFSEAVTGVDMVGPSFDDFALTTIGVSGAAISGVSGSGATYTVTVNTGSNDGTIRLDIPDTATVNDLAGNPLGGLPYISGDTYIINKPPPAAILTAPTGNIGADYNPNYQWDKVTTATRYRLYIAESAGTVHDQWYAADSICDATTCTVTPGPSATLTGGTYSWFVQTRNSVGDGPWSNNAQPTTFSVTAPSAPGAATLTYPAQGQNIGTDFTPTYTWNKVNDATYYHVYVGGSGGAVLDQWYQASAVCGASTCSINPSSTLRVGNYNWFIQTYGAGGYGPWSNNTQPTNFSTTATSVPGAATLTYPAQGQDIGTNYDPTYTWNKVNTATWYRVYVSGPTGTVLDQWVQASVVCGVSTCSMTPTVTLSGGAYSWFIQTWNPAGSGPWSNNAQPTNFTATIPSAPIAATLTYPAQGQNIGTDFTPTYTWNKVNDATWYHVYVGGAGGAVLDQWYQASAVCGASTCSINPSSTLSVGSYNWFIQTYGAGGYGPWSNNAQPTTFSTTATSVPGATTLTYPAQGQDIGTDYTPTYQWNKLSTATWYRVYVSGPSGTVFDQWYQASVVCGASACSITPTNTLNGGSYSWYVQAWNPAGTGPWSNNAQPTNFTATLQSAPTGVVLTAPTGTITTLTPTFSWSKVNMATWYHLYIKGPYGVVQDQWYQGVNICNVSTCSVSDITLTSGDHTWWVQTYNSLGYGPWKKGVFSVQP